MLLVIIAFVAVIGLISFVTIKLDVKGKAPKNTWGDVY